MENILKIPLDTLNYACEQMRIDTLSEQEREFLFEYHEILTPIVSALKTLSANKYSFGLYLPVLIGLRQKLSAAKSKDNVYGMPLVVAVETGFNRRFSEFLNLFDEHARSTPLYIAMASNPQFKLNFLGFKQIPHGTSNAIFDLLLNAGKEILAAERERDKNRTDSVDNADVKSTSSKQGKITLQFGDFAFTYFIRMKDFGQNVPIYYHHNLMSFSAVMHSFIMCIFFSFSRHIKLAH